MKETRAPVYSVTDRFDLGSVLRGLLAGMVTLRHKIYDAD